MIDYHALAPEILLALTALAVISVDLLPVRKYWTVLVGLVGVALAFVPVLTLGLCESLSNCSDTGSRLLYGESYVVDTFSLILKGLFLAAAFVALLLSVGYIESDRYWQGEFYFLMLVSVLGALVMASSRDLVTMFVGLELVTGPTFLMAGWRKGNDRSNEAALKFFIIGVLSAAVLLFGMSLIYGTTGELTFAGIRSASAAVLGGDLRGLFIVGVVFTLLGFAFKVSAVPFHFWTPDTYQGAPTPVTAYLSVVSKAAGFVGLLAMCYLAFAEIPRLWGAGLWIMAVLSMTVGNLIALRQTNVVRLLGYSSIAQGGFILVPFGVAIAADVSGTNLADAFFASVTYLLIYAFMNLGVFAVVIAVGNRVKSDEISDWAGLFTYSPQLAALLAVFLFSLAGVPPLAGWFAKFVMFRSVLSAGGSWGAALAVIAVVNSVVAFYYYSKVVVAVFMLPVPEAVPAGELRHQRIEPALKLALVVTAVGVVALGIFPGFIAEIGDATRSFASGF